LGAELPARILTWLVSLAAARQSLTVNCQQQLQPTATATDFSQPLVPVLGFDYAPGNLYNLFV
jgi:hypothetical protein